MTRFVALLAVTTAITSLSTSVALADPDFVAAIGGGPMVLSGQGLFSGTPDVNGYHLRGLISGSYNFTPVLGVQGDVLIRHDALDNSGNTSTINGVDGALHGFYRDPDSFLLGGFVQLGQDTYTFPGDDSTTARRTVVGVEGQAFFDQVTVYGQLGWHNLAPEFESTDMRGWFITGEVRYFLTPDFMIEAHAGRSELAASISSASLQFETVNVGAGAEYKFEDQPFSIFAKYDYTTNRLNFLADASIDSHRVLAGVKFNLGDGTLQDRDRNGVSLKPFDINSVNALITGFGPSVP